MRTLTLVLISAPIVALACGDLKTVGPDAGPDATASDVAPPPPDAPVVTFSVSGDVFYLQPGKAATLKLNGGDPQSVLGDATKPAHFAFKQQLKMGDPYTITAEGSDCWVTNGTGTASADVSVEVRCVTAPSATSSVGGTTSAGNMMSAFSDFPGSPALTVKTDRAMSDVLLSFYVPEVQQPLPKWGSAEIQIEVDGAPVSSSKRLQSYYEDSGQCMTVLALQKLAAGAHTIKAKWRALGSDVVTLPQSPTMIYGTPINAPVVPYTSVLSAVVLDSLSIYEGSEGPTPIGNVKAPAAGGADAGVFTSVGATNVVGQAGRKAIVMFHAPDVRTTPYYTGAALRLGVDGKVAASAQIAATSDPQVERGVSILSLVDLPANGTLATRWSLLQDQSYPLMTGTLAPESFNAAVYLTPKARTVSAPFEGSFSVDKATPTVVPGVTATLSAPRAGKALLFFQAATLLESGGFPAQGEAAIYASDPDAGADASAGALYAHVQSVNGVFQSATMVRVIDVPAGDTTFDVRLRSRHNPAVEPIYLHYVGDPNMRSALSAIFLE